MSTANESELITYLCPKEISDRLRAIAAEQDRSMASVIRQACRAWLEKEGGK